ncbi:MAG: FKBP-type peptidyl-prolyl cis-trans isomerase [Nanoarchaeota archaeon]
MSIKDGDKVKIEYTGKLDDGTVFDSSKHGDHSHPLEFEVGKKMIIQGLEDEIKGMEKGQEKTVKITKDKAYGDRNEELSVKITKDKLPQDQEVKEGMMLMMQSPDGRQMPAVVKEVGDSDITIDLNHPLAGKDLTFEFKVVEVSSGDAAGETEEKAE